MGRRGRQIGSGEHGGLRTLWGLAVSGVVVGLGAAWLVSGGGGSSTRQAPIPSVTDLDLPAGVPSAAAAVEPAPPTLAQEPPDAAAALGILLSGLAGDDPASAWPVLDRASRQRYPTPAAWLQSLADQPRPLTFALGPSRPEAGGVVVEVAATHQPSLDRFRGLVPAQSTSTWRVTDEEGRWRVGAEPLTFVAVLPPDDGARAAAGSWLARLQACDRAGAAGLQAGPDLYGPADLPGLPCSQGGTWAVGEPAALDRVPDPSSYLAAFGAAATAWARVVPVTGPRAGFFATLAPMGDTWRVIGTAVA